MNFDSTIVGQPYSRIDRISIDYTAPSTATVEFHSREYVKLLDGTSRPVADPSTERFNVSPEDMPKMVPVVSSDTGVPLGVSMSYGQVMLGILAVIRAKQSGQ